MENEYTTKILPNGLDAAVGLYQPDYHQGIKTYFTQVYFVDSDGKVEVVGHGYREDYTDSDRIVMTFCFGGTVRVNEDISTGLEMVYCAPQRQR